MTEHEDGTTESVESYPDGSSVVTIETTDGTTAIISTDRDGNVKTEVKVSEEAIQEAIEEGTVLPLPLPATEAESDQTSAPIIAVFIPGGSSAVVEVPVKNVTPNTVAVIVAEDGTEKVVKLSAVTDGGVAIPVSGDANVKIVEKEVAFTDIEDSWAEDEILFATAREIFNGTSATTFSPTTTVTRAVMMVSLSRLDGMDLTGGAEWFEPGTEWAVDQKISDGANLHADITREQLVTMLYRYAGTPETDGNLGAFVDNGEVHTWAKDAMAWAVDVGLIKGVGNSCLNPLGHATRAELVTVIARYCQLVNGIL